MHFFYFDAQGAIHSAQLSTPLVQPIIDIDLHWLSLGHKIFPQRLHGMACFEKINAHVPEDHQFTFRSWYDRRCRSTHCVWYSFPKTIFKRLLEQPLHAQCIAFILPRYFPPSCRNKSVVCFVDVLHCECVVGYVQGHCVCFKKLSSKTQINVQQEWQYLQQAYPQWTFEHSVYLTSQRKTENTLVQTHQQTIHIDASLDTLQNRITLYGLT